MIKCEICEREFMGFKELSNHIVRTHKIKIEDYYLKFIGEKGKCKACGKDTRFNSLGSRYSMFCSQHCSANNFETREKKKETRLKNNNGVQHKLSKYQENHPILIKCKICGKECARLATHITNKHKMKSEEYYLKFIGEKGKCKTCGKDTKFYDLRHGYNKFCNAKCIMNNFEILKKKKETCLKNYNVEYPCQNKKISDRIQESTLKNNDGIHPCKLTYQQCQERYPDVVKIEKLKEGPNGEILGHCKNANCKNSKENGGYFDVSKYLGLRNDGINGNDTNHFYCCEECKHTCPLYGRSAAQLHTRINENKNIPYTQVEYNTWKEEVYYRQRMENNTDTNFCEYCHATEDLHVHHEVPQKIVPGYALDPDNGIIACEKCHYEKGHATGTECSTGNLANKICK